MATEADRLFAALFPGQRYSPDQAALLAARLRQAADSLERVEVQEPPVADEPAADDQPLTKKRKKELRGRGKDLDFANYQQRYVALELLYLGHAYQGFARQADSDETIEGHLFSALRKTRLVPPGASWQELRYSRGGRTDKGVSALGQVVALLLRSAARPGDGAAAPPPPPAGELDYPALLNRVLPPDIRVLGWTDVPEDFSARFSAQHREYKYLIAAEEGWQLPLDAPQPPAAAAGGGAQQPPPPSQQQQQQQQGTEAPPGLAPRLDLGAMREAAAHLVGEHDFRNFCKVDVAQVQNFRRRILDFRIEALPGCAWGGRVLLQLHIRGTAFLWHQVRCMAAVLLMVGRGEEQPGVVATLLDVAATPCKPQYAMASEEPLLLYACAYGGLAFHRSPANYALVRSQLEAALTSHMIRAGLLHTVQAKLAADALSEELAGGGAAAADAAKRASARPGGGGRHIPLLARAKEPAVEERLLKVADKRAAAGGEAAGAGAREGEQPAGKGRRAVLCGV